MKISVAYDARAEHPIRMNLGYGVYHLSADEARVLRDQLRAALVDNELEGIHDTDPPPEDTRPDTPDAVRRASSGELKLDLPT
jgi:hypothetical protein